VSDDNKEASLRVLQVIPAVAPRYGGPSQAVFEMCRALSRRGLEVLIATTDVDGRGRLPDQTGSEIEYHGVPTIFFRGLGERFNYSPTLARWLDANVREFAVVHIHAVFSHPCIAAARACRKHNIPYIVRPLGSLDPWSMQQKPLRKRLMWQMAAARMLREAASIHYTTSEEQRLAESSLALDHGVVIPLGVDVEAIQNPAGETFREHQPTLGNNPYVLALSRIHPKKNIELLIEAFLELTKRPELSQWRLVIAGDGDSAYLAKLRALVDETGAHDKVVFAGWVEGTMKASAIQQAALFASPSRQENFGIAAAEALACGVPVVVSEHVNLAPEIARANAGWVTSLEPADFSRALGEAMTSGEERERRGRAGKLFVERNLSWENTAKELEQLYSGAIRSKTFRGSHR
jgi:glycosyltransferase involved in cell wall biosynthesis